ncbi:MAG: UDP-N-acetylmuramoyl-L-alanyl-D-glutamate--2,6-diaminopimelate ligase [Acidimicrobiales bacterium]
MQLDRLLSAAFLDHAHPGMDPGRPAVETEVTGVTDRLDQVGPGSIFVALSGRRTDGHQLVEEAVAAGAAAVVVERETTTPERVARVLVGDSRAALALLSSAYWDHPSRKMTVVGITGTNGKTTTAAFLRAIMQEAGQPAETIGTLGRPRVCSDPVPASAASVADSRSPQTTPGAADLQRCLARLAESGTKAVAMEVSSHALDQQRVVGTHFAVSVFTNLSPDHLDYHGSMEAYFKAKARLFSPDLSKRAVVNGDDPWGARLATSARIPVRAFGRSDASDAEIDGEGTSFRWRGHSVRVMLAGEANLYNALAAATAADVVGIDPGAVACGLSSVLSVEGRMTAVRPGGSFSVLVDYAHSPAALGSALAAVRLLAAGGPVAVVFGCGGDRDREKRPMMGRVAEEGAQVVIVTTDNPRGEDPAGIGADILAGMVHPERARILPDRRGAIAEALAWAQRSASRTPGRPVVLVAGKGHERTQEMAGASSPFDDAAVAAEEMERLGC